MRIRCQVFRLPDMRKAVPMDRISCVPESVLQAVSYTHLDVYKRQMLGLLLMEKDCSKEAAQMLYQGLVADNVRFTTTSVRKETFQAAGFLFEKGADVVQDVYKRQVADRCQNDKNVPYEVIKLSLWMSVKISSNRIKYAAS